MGLPRNMTMTCGVRNARTSHAHTGGDTQLEDWHCNNTPKQSFLSLTCRTKRTGLSAYLHEIEEKLVPLLKPHAPMNLRLSAPLAPQ